MRTLIFIIGGVVGLFALRRITKKDIEQRFAENLKQIRFDYGYDIARDVERIYRLETNNLKSKQFLDTYSAGMMAISKTFPYGWLTINRVYWSKYPQYKPVGVSTHEENKGLSGEGGGPKMFVKFGTLKAAMNTLAGFLRYYSNAGRWYSKNSNDQIEYKKALNNIRTYFT